MEMARSEPVCIASNVGESFSEQCLTERIGEYQELEQFWGEEKQRLQDLDGQTKPLSNSLEEHLMYDDFIEEPRKDSIGEADVHIVRGQTNNDIPTTYVISGFGPNELVVIGTFVDKSIVPGFQYKVRKNLSQDYLFEGRGLYLESVGLGYGKRITFQGDTLNHNDNYFWSDSRTHGFGFTLQTIRPDSAFTAVHATTRTVIGRIVVKHPAPLTEDIELSTVSMDSGRIEKRVRVHFICDLTLSDGSSIQDVHVRGVVLVVREDVNSRAKTEEITLENFIIQNCQLFPEE